MIRRRLAWRCGWAALLVTAALLGGWASLANADGPAEPAEEPAEPAARPAVEAAPRLSLVPVDDEALSVVEEQGHLHSDRRQARFSSYLGFLAQRVQLAMSRWVIRLLSHLTDAGWLLLFAARALVWLALVAILVALGIVLSRRFGRAKAGRSGTAIQSTPLTATPIRGAEGWRREIEERLQAGDVAGALEAAWWWLAESVALERVDPTWTSRELIDRAGRLELMSVVRVLDRLVYGPRHPQTEDVRSLVELMERSLPVAEAAS